ncbi:MAG: sulfatase [Proteobacteria bacterium]|nr:sulfatase [Pseudomonadota bacterium]
MSRPTAAIVIALVASLVIAALIPRPEVQRFKTPQCRANKLQPHRPPTATQPPNWAPPAPSQRLAEISGKITGTPGAEVGPLLSLDETQLAAWQEFTFSGGEVGFQSPVLNADLGDATTVRLELVPGNTVHVELTASFDAKIDRRQRGLRTMAFQLDGAEANEVTVLEGPLSEVVGGNWDDDRYPHRTLKRFELRVPNATEREGMKLKRLEILGPTAAYAGTVAGQRTLEVDGVLRPGWFVHGGAAVDLDVDAGAGTLSTYVAALGDVTGTLTVGEDRLELEPGADWSHHALPVAGGRVRFEAEGDGVLLIGAPQIQPPRSENTPNIIVVLADTLRADHLGAWGNGAGVSPNIDALADEGATFGLAQSTAAWTKPAIPTLMTGIWATTHQVGTRSYTDRLPSTVPTLQSTLSAQGWRTGNFSASPLGSTLTGLEVGFDVATAPRHWAGEGGALGHASLAALTDEMLSWWDDSEGPVFAYLHAMEVHAWRRGPYKGAPKAVRTSYDRAILDLDTKMGALRDALEERGELDRTLIVFTSDHGESFGDHGEKDHGTALTQSQIHIPLIFWAKDLPASWSNAPVGLADVAPTILDLAGVPPLEEADGSTLKTAMYTGDVVHSFVPSARERFVWRYMDAPIYAVTMANQMKYVRQEGGYTWWFDLNDDLCEAETSQWPAWFAERALDKWLEDQHRARKAFAERHPQVGSGLRADDVRMLEEMGYLGGEP